MLLREVSVENGADTEHAILAAVRGEDAHALRLKRLVPERKRGCGARAMEPHVAVVGDLADGIRRGIERARDHASRRARAHTADEIPDGIARESRKRLHEPRAGDVFGTGWDGKRDPPGDGFGD